MKTITKFIGCLTLGIAANFIHSELIHRIDSRNESKPEALVFVTIHCEMDRKEYGDFKSYYDYALLNNKRVLVTNKSKDGKVDVVVTLPASSKEFDTLWTKYKFEPVTKRQR